MQTLQNIEEYFKYNDIFSDARRNTKLMIFFFHLTISLTTLEYLKCTSGNTFYCIHQKNGFINGAADKTGPKQWISVRGVKETNKIYFSFNLETYEIIIGIIKCL